ncbi:fungal-specific transcription factor domain-containing protein [Dactylonectria estremocensis]|uniref:Fungal-specific transcription factor domain-containing protein n=1 Tax=Dactylonectria estremocensis TaxID=1079267 RepID=A0A9P9DYY1_9HYPO|nr:fungal-specific transcription factor domain-containing protein [Dactylonectria estremocensis]
MEHSETSRSRLRRSDRTRVACRRCNSKKVKCTAASGIPCQGCITSRSECVLIDSQRGRYTRRRGRAPEDPPVTTMVHPSVVDGILSPQHPQSPADSLSQYQPSLNEGPASTVSGAESHIEEDGGHILQELSRSFERRAPRDCNAMLYLHITDQSVSSRQQPIHDAISTLYVGESFSLTYVIDDVLGPFLSDRLGYQRRLHFPIAEGFDPSDTGRRNIVNAQLKLLREEGILHLVSADALTKLVGTYFCWFHPCFPLISQPGFLQSCIENQMSLLVLNAVLLVAVTICDAADFLLTGCATRYQAREAFYRQAKALYDADSDPDKVNNITAVFLMSFWWNGSNDEKDSWHWLGIAISLAQSLGMHRSTAKSHMNEEKTKLWKRIWWCLRIRDTLTSGSIGRPQHFGNRDCDVEMLEPSDILDFDSDDESERKYYACQMARLSTIFSDIIASRYAAKGSDDRDQKLGLENSLDTFRSQIPPILQYRGIEGKAGQGLLASMLLMAYNFGVILLCRPPSSIGDESSTAVWGNRSKATEAANETTRVMEDILSISAVRLCQIHTIPALFNSLSMHVFALCTSGSIGRELSENRARICMLGLACLQDSWPVSGWILKLFVDIMKRLRKKLSGVAGPSIIDNLISDSETEQANRPGGRGQYVLQTGQHNQHKSPRTTLHSGSTTASRIPVASPTLPNDGVTTDTLNTELFPNLFMLDDILSDCSTNQVNFFDLLTVPNFKDLDTFLE